MRVLVPNIITLLALAAGLTGIRMAVEGRLELALGAIVFAAALDAIDGRIARMIKGTSRFGAELDSLADFVNFGVAPALILYFWGLHELKTVGWIAVLVFAICAGLRLARFNVAIDDPDKPAFTANFFTGMPAPAGALTSLLPLYLSFLGFSIGPAAAPIALVYLLGLAFLTVSTIPVYSGKTIGLRVPRHWVLPIFVISVAVFGLLANFPWEMLTAVTILFLASIPIGVLRYRQLDRAHAASAAPGLEPVSTEGEPPPAA